MKHTKTARKFTPLSHPASEPEPIEPDGYALDMEQQFRVGFYHGVAETLDRIDDLYSKGYVRPSEIRNIIESWLLGPVQKWRYAVDTEQPLCTCGGYPELECDSWRDIRDAVFHRDGNRCSECGGTKHLQAHHVNPVHTGGRAKLSNLITLCKKCHHAHR